MVKRFFRESGEDRECVQYNETIFPWMRRFVWLWVKHWRQAVLFALVGLPAAHYVASSYGYTIGYFWLIYAPVCGLFFNNRHYYLDGEGPYYLNGGVSASGRTRTKRWVDRF